MKSSRSLILLVLAPLALTQPQLQFAPAGTTYSSMVPSPAGDIVLAGSYNSVVGGLSPSSATHAQILVAGIGSAPFERRGLGGSGNDLPQTAAVDSHGNIWIAGETDSDDFTLVNPIVAKKVPYRTAGFVLELDPTGTNLLFATYLGGDLPQAVFPGTGTAVTGMTIDGAGNVYVGGTTNEADFPITPGVAMTQGPPVVALNYLAETFYYSFVTKISPGGKLLYSTFLGTGASECQHSGISCQGEQSTYSAVTSMAVNAAGILTVAGTESGIAELAYLSRLSADASVLTPLSFAPAYGPMTNLVVAEDSSGNLDLLGQYHGPAASPGLFAAKLGPDRATVIYSVDLGQSADAKIAGLVLDASGNPYLAGTSSSVQFPVLAGVPNLGGDFALQLDPSGTTAKMLFRFPTGTVSMPPALDPSGQLLLAGSTGAVLSLPVTYAFNTPAIAGFANAASFHLNTGLFPGELVALYGWDLSQTTQVLIGGVPARILYSSPTQINLQVPFETKTGLAQVALAVGSSETQAPVAPSLGIFTSDGVHAAALNQDGTVNSTSNPAARGSIVTLYGTGAIWPSGVQDGAIATSAMPLDQEQNQFEMVDNLVTPGTILYAGAAPDLIDGVFQLNVQMPPDAVLPLILRASIGGTTLSSNPVQIYFK